MPTILAVALQSLGGQPCFERPLHTLQNAVVDALITLPVQDRDSALSVALSSPTALSEEELTDIHKQVSVALMA